MAGEKVESKRTQADADAAEDFRGVHAVMTEELDRVRARHPRPASVVIDNVLFPPAPKPGWSAEPNPIRRARDNELIQVTEPYCAADFGGPAVDVVVSAPDLDNVPQTDSEWRDRIGAIAPLSPAHATADMLAGGNDVDVKVVAYDPTALVSAGAEQA
jgi:hypothetical protein